MKQKLFYFLFALSICFNLAWAILNYCTGDLAIKERLMTDVMYALLDKGITSEEIKSFKVKQTLPFQSNYLDLYQFKEGWEIQIVFANRPDEIQFYFYSEGAGDELDGISIPKSRLK